MILPFQYTLLQNKCTLILPSSPGGPESLTLTLGHVNSVIWSLHQYAKYPIPKIPELRIGDLETSEEWFSCAKHSKKSVYPTMHNKRPWPWVMSILSYGLYSNMQKTLFENDLRSGWWRRDLKRYGWFSCAKHSKKSVYPTMHKYPPQIIIDLCCEYICISLLIWLMTAWCFRGALRL